MSRAVLSDSNLGYAVHHLDDECCPAVVSKVTFFSTLGFLFAGTVYIVALLLAPLLLGGGGRRRSRRFGPLDAWVKLLGIGTVDDIEILSHLRGENLILLLFSNVKRGFLVQVASVRCSAPG